MSKERLLQANINKLLSEKHDNVKLIVSLKQRIQELEEQLSKPKTKKKDGQQDSKA